MRTYVWTLPTRAFHLIFAIYIVLSFLSSEWEYLLNIHAALGYGIAVLLLFRLVWGVVGPRYSKFSDWPFSFKELKKFLLNIRSANQNYVGHNPAASWVMAGILATAFITTLSGMLTFGIQEGRGLFSSLNSTFFKQMEFFEEAHEFFATILLWLIAIHMAGLITDRLLHKNGGALLSICHGYKSVKSENAKLNAYQKVVAAFFILLSLAVPIYALSTDSPLLKSEFTPIEYSKIEPDFVEECASCHTLYPPFLLPTENWKVLMSGLESHFGDDASIDEELSISIENFLTTNSADSSTKEAAVYIKHSLKNKKDIIAITDTAYWKKKHKEIPKSVFESKRVKSASNCKACHKNIENGLIEDFEIEIPKG